MFIKILNKNLAFTLAEVLITLGIIGIVAAMTIPTLIANYQKQQTVSKLKKFYSTINQAIKLSEVDNGFAAQWQYPPNGRFNPDVMEEWFNKYFAKYFVYKDIQKTEDGILIKMSGGDIFAIYATSDVKLNPHIIYFANQSSCDDYISNNDNHIFYNGYPLDGKNNFLFSMNKEKGIIETYFYAYPGDERSKELFIRNGKNMGCAETYKYFCAALIEISGWQIPKDYPVKW